LKAVPEGDEKSRRNYLPSEIGDVFACGSTTTIAMVKRRPRRDSTHQIGSEIPLHGVLIVVGTCSTGWRNKFGRNFLPSEFGMFLLVAPQPKVL